MTEPLLLEDPDDAALVLGASGVLRDFNTAGVLTAADVHVATSIGRLGGETDETVLLATALAIRGLRQGSVCIDLSEQHVIEPEIDWPEPQSWSERVRSSALTTGDGPLRWDLGLLYLDRYWRQEIQVCFDLLNRAAQPAPTVDPARLTAGLTRLFPEHNLQRRAAEVAAGRWITVLGGGPGTGKTTTIARLLALLLDQPGPPLRVAMAAPTGKAAARLQEAVEQAATEFGAEDRARLGTRTASTLHRLLGSKFGYGTRFKHDRDNRLPFDVIVVDETSMVSLTMMARLLEAVRPNARLILVGDPDQLASVEAGAVLADLVAGLTARGTGGSSVEPGAGSGGSASELSAATGGSASELSTVTGGSSVEPGAGSGGSASELSAATGGSASELSTVTVGSAAELRAAGGGSAAELRAAGGGSASELSAAGGSDEVDGSPYGVVVLKDTYRFFGGIAELAQAVKAGDQDAAMDILLSDLVDVTFDDDGLRDDVVEAADALRTAAVAAEPDAALQALEMHRVLCAHRTGPFGVEDWSWQIERWLAEARGAAPEGEWYFGRPVLVTANDYLLGLYNGDTGVVVADSLGEPRVAFRRAGHIVGFAPSRLSGLQTVHAMTVHRSQGSQFQKVTLVLPEPDSPLLTREMLYTALTRAQRHVRIVGTEEAFRQAIGRRAARASGLRERLANG